jgi:CRISPR-associated Cas5-like protein
VENILRAELVVPFWCSFRDPTSINVHNTFRLPPLTTLFGLVANAMGLEQDDYTLRPQVRFAIGIRQPGELVETYSKIMKVREAKTPTEAAKPGNLYISTAVIKQKLVQPVFRMYILADNDLLTQIQTALNSPARPLYLGESDDVVDVIAPAIISARVVQTNRFDCAVHDMRSLHASEPPASVVNLPYNFARRGKSDWALQRRLYVYRLTDLPLVLETENEGLEIEGRHIIFEPPIEGQSA